MCTLCASKPLVCTSTHIYSRSGTYRLISCLQTGYAQMCMYVVFMHIAHISMYVGVYKLVCIDASTIPPQPWMISCLDVLGTHDMP